MRISILLCVIFFASCKGKGKVVSKGNSTDTIINKDIKPNAFRSYNLIDDYMVVDTGEYGDEGPMSGGTYGIIKKNNLHIDTVDLHYGMRKLNNGSYFYLKLIHAGEASLKDKDGFLVLTRDKYLLINGTTKTEFNSMVPSFDDYFSSPGVINKLVCFWQLEKLDSVGALKVSAAEYNPLTRKTQLHFLLNDTLETDNSNYFCQPFEKNNKLIFIGGNEKQWKFSKDFKLE